MLQETLVRVDGIASLQNTIVVCNEEHRFIVAEQLLGFDLEHTSILLEPEGRNTAPAIALAALQATQHHPEATLLVLPADHQITDVERFKLAISQGTAHAESGKLVTFGIAPNSPHTGYGYIQRGELIDDGCFEIEKFVEKPDIELAKKYVASKQWFWNSGMFLLNAKTYLDELRAHQPDVFDQCSAAFGKRDVDRDFIRVDKSAFLKSPSISIDYGVMERTSRAVVVPMDADWSDVGSWEALWHLTDKDGAGNVVRGDVLMEEVNNSFLYSENRLLAAVGIEGLVIIETADAVLVASKEQVQKVKDIVRHLKKLCREETLTHRRTARPWGTYECIDQEERFKVKRIMVKPGASLSLQKHNHRAEHWVVVKGTAKVTCGEETYLLTENQSTYIPLGTVHRLENPGKIPLEIVEIQSGTYLGEDDIERLDDSYGRSN